MTGILFFGSTLSFGKHNKGIDQYAESVDRERVVLFDRIKLPLIVNKETRSEYREVTVTLTEAEARAEAESDMARLISEELGQSEILEKKTEEEYTDVSYKLKCRLYCLTDIAYEKEIILNKNTDENERNT